MSLDRVRDGCKDQRGNKIEHAGTGSKRPRAGAVHILLIKELKPLTYRN